MIGSFLISFYFNQQDDRSEDIILGKNVTTYNLEPKWWLKPQTYGMFNYYADTNYTRLKITNSNVNGYRLVYNLNDFDYKKDIELAHKKNIKYIAGMLFDITKNETNNNINPSQICLPYEIAKNNSLQKAEKIIDLNVDGLVIIHPFGDHFFMDYRTSCFCPENSNLTKQYQLNCAVEFYKQFVKKIKVYAKSKGKDNFPVSIATYSYDLFLLTVDMLPFSDFDFSCLSFEGGYTHTGNYKLHFSATKAPLITSPVDISFGWLIKNSKKPEDFIQIKMAEAYANKGAFQDQYRSEERRVGKECRSRWSPYH